MKVWNQLNKQVHQQTCSAQKLEDYRKQSNIIWGNTFKILSISYTRRHQNFIFADKGDDDHPEEDLTRRIKLKEWMSEYDL